MSIKLPQNVYTIEVANKGNNPVTFPPTKTKLNARWDYSNCLNRNIGDPGHKSLAMEFRDGIPGMCVQVDTETFIGRIFWPQSLDGDGEDIRKRMAAIFKRHQTSLGPPPTFDPPAEFRLSADDMKAWLYNMRRMLDAKLAKYVPGSATDLPSTAVITQLPGKLPRDPFFEGDQEGTGGPGDHRPLKWTHDVTVPKNYGVDHDVAAAERELEREMSESAT